MMAFGEGFWTVFLKRKETTDTEIKSNTVYILAVLEQER